MRSENFEKPLMMDNTAISNDPFGDNTFSLKYTKNVAFWIMYYPGAWNYDAIVKVLVIALWLDDNASAC